MLSKFLSLCRLDTLTGCRPPAYGHLQYASTEGEIWLHVETSGRWRVCTRGVVLTKNIKDLSCTEGWRPEYSQCSHVMINFSTTKVPTVIMGSCPCSLPGMHYLYLLYLLELFLLFNPEYG